MLTIKAIHQLFQETFSDFEYVIQMAVLQDEYEDLLSIDFGDIVNFEELVEFKDTSDEFHDI